MLLHSRLLARVPGLVHGFTTRRGPGSGDFGRGASPADWAALASALGVAGAPVAYASQVHGADVIEATAGGLAGEADALVARQRGLLIAVRVADCVPVLVAGPMGVAAIHAGWRGVAAGVVGAGVAALGGSGPLVAAVGPCISGARYEVGPEVIEGIAAAGVPREVFVRPGPCRDHADLASAVAWQLRAAGVDEVDVLGACTLSDPALHSFRRDGDLSGRIAGVLGML